jgi:putative RecB family exonuclease
MQKRYRKKSKIYSHSRLSTFEQCPLKFKFRYIDHIKPVIEATIESHLGSAIHSTLEWLYTEVMSKRIPKIDDMINYYAVKWQETYSDDTLIIKKELTQKDYFSKGVHFLITYYNAHYPFNDNTLEVEKHIIINLDSERKIQGFIDRLTYNPETAEYEIHDYKTSNYLPLKEKFENDRQLALYAIAIKEIFGNDKKVCLIWHYLAHNQKICSRKTNEQLEQLKKEVLELINQIEKTEKFEARKSALCNWCEYKDYCPAWGNRPPRRDRQTELIAKDKISKDKLLDIW